MAHLHFGLRQDLMRVSRFQRGASQGYGRGSCACERPLGVPEQAVDSPCG